MNYYQHHIGDYRRDTAHLSLLEHGAYRQLLDMYYLSETNIPEETEVVYRRLCARTDEEKKAIDTVLAEFFKRENGWSHKRCDHEISEYQSKADRARSNGKLGGRPTKTKVVISETKEVFYSNPEKANHKPLTKNHKPLTTNQEPLNPVAVDTTLVPDIERERQKAPHAQRLPSDFSLSPEWMQHAQGIRPEWNPLQVADVFAMFRDHWVAKSGKDATKVDWLATWRNWCRREKSFSRDGPNILTPGQRKAAVSKANIADWLAESADTNAINGEFEQ